MSEHAKVEARIDSLLSQESDFVAAQATVSCELHHTFEHFHWTGYYRFLPRASAAKGEEDPYLTIGPYQGTHGCLRIKFSKGVCGACARTRSTQLVPDVNAFPGHIACSSTTQSEIVCPVVCSRTNELLAVLDVDSNLPNAFTEEDKRCLESICRKLGERAWETGIH